MGRKYLKGRLRRHPLKGNNPQDSKSVKVNRFDSITDKSNLYEAFKKVKGSKAKKTTFGTDKITVEHFERNLQNNLDTLHRELIEGRYRPRPLKKAWIPQWNKKDREISIPTIRDKVAQQAVLNIIQDDVESEFLDCSFGYRKGIGSHNAIKRIYNLIAEGNNWIVKGDIKGCFNNIPHRRLLELCRHSIREESILGLIKEMITAGLAAPDGSEELEPLGTPQGAVISPFLANIYLHQLDGFAAARGYNLIRYADDWVMLFKTKEEAQAAAERTLDFIEGSLELKSEVKDGLDTVSNLQQEFTFLGYTFYPGGLKPSKKVQEKLIGTLPEKIDDYFNKPKNRDKHLTIENVAGGVNPVLKGWYDYYSLGGRKKLYRTLDKEVRRIVKQSAREEKQQPVTNEYIKQSGLLSLASYL